MKSNRNVTRRKFIAATAATAAASYLRPGMSYAFSGARGVDATNLAWRDQGVLNVVNSPYAKLHSVPVRAVTIDEGFWSKRRKINVERSIPTMREQLEAAWAHGQLPSLGGEEQGAAEGAVLFGFGHL